MLTSLVSGKDVLCTDEFSCSAKETVCITGHREKSILPYNNDPLYKNMTVTAVKLMLYRYIDMAAERVYVSFISGLATGADLWAAEYILEKKSHGSSIRLIGAMPYLRHAEGFSEYNRRLLCRVENGADVLVTVSSDPNAVYSKFESGKYLYRDRNYFMVDHSSAVIAFLNSGASFSGTSQTVNYAYRSGRRICRFGTEDIYRIIDDSGADIRSIKRDISFMENVFDSPY